MLKFSAAREAMIDSQIRPNGITDRRIIDAMATIPREDFVPEDRKAIAYLDEDLPLLKDNRRRYLIEPMAFAKLVQLAEIKPSDKVLHVGAATGYGTAVLARLSAQVVALESDAALVTAARHNLQAAANIIVVEGALNEGAKSMAPFDVILIEGRIEAMPESLLAQTAEGGRVVAVLGESAVAKGCLWITHGGISACRTAFDASVAALPGFERTQPPFVFQGFNEALVG
jgi:protein-L-isoaspartate(D-aspartate) O-methyltransferase